MIFFFVAVLLAGCGQNPSTPEKPQIKHAQTASQCPLRLPKSGLCASVTWNEGPHVVRTSSYTVRVWNETSGSANGPYLDPSGKFESYGEKSCGCLRPGEITKVATGVYSVRQVVFDDPKPAQWKIVIKVGEDDVVATPLFEITR